MTVLPQLRRTLDFGEQRRHRGQDVRPARVHSPARHGPVTVGRNTLADDALLDQNRWWVVVEARANASLSAPMRVCMGEFTAGVLQTIRRRR